MAEKQIVFVDLDEVLADFVGAALRMHGWSREEFEKRQPIGTWDMTLGLDMDKGTFWSMIAEQGSSFWAFLPRTPWFCEMLTWLESLDCDWYILSAPPRGSAGYIGKTIWLKEKFGINFTRFFITPHKELLAAEGRILIDDRQRNLDRFESAGGRGILFPSLFNSAFTHRHNPVAYVKEQYNALTIQQR